MPSAHTRRHRPLLHALLGPLRLQRWLWRTVAPDVPWTLAASGAWRTAPCRHAARTRRHPRGAAHLAGGRRAGAVLAVAGQHVGGLVHQDLPHELHGLLQDRLERCAHRKGGRLSAPPRPLPRRWSRSCGSGGWAGTGAHRAVQPLPTLPRTGCGAQPVTAVTKSCEWSPAFLRGLQTEVCSPRKPRPAYVF